MSELLTWSPSMYKAGVSCSSSWPWMWRERARKVKTKRQVTSSHRDPERWPPYRKKKEGIVSLLFEVVQTDHLLLPIRGTKDRTYSQQSVCLPLKLVAPWRWLDRLEEFLSKGRARQRDSIRASIKVTPRIYTQKPIYLAIRPIAQASQRLSKWTSLSVISTLIWKVLLTWEEMTSEAVSQGVWAVGSRWLVVQRTWMICSREASWKSDSLCWVICKKVYAKWQQQTSPQKEGE